MSSICIIPARGGSKRLHRKNILLLDGRPLIGWVIQSCQNANIFDDIIVSSDDPEILNIAGTYGATSINRDKSLANDRSTVDEVCLDILQQYECENFCCIYPTNALLSAETICKSHVAFMGVEKSDRGTMIGVSSYNYPPVQALDVTDPKNVRLMYPELALMQSQFHPKTRVSNGTLYWATKNVFETEKSFYSSKMHTFDVSEDEVCDLNTEEDFEALKSKYWKQKV